MVILWTCVVEIRTAEAIPAFASKYDKGCSYCHSSQPDLNKRGRRFKELGYRLPEDVGKDIPVSDYLELGSFPISARVISRPFDKKDSGDAMARAIHEVEVFIAGAVGRNWSTFFEFEAEDENNFEPEVAPAVLTYNLHPMLNIQAAWGPAFWADPYSTLTDNRRLTRGRPAVIERTFGGADGVDGALNSNRQTVSITGRLFDRLFYLVGVNGEAGDSLGLEASNFHGRLAFDITPDIMVGGFGLRGDTGSHTETSIVTDPATGFLKEVSETFPDRSYERWGFDAQADFKSEFGLSRVWGAFVHARDDDALDVADEENNAFSIQGLHIFRTKEGKPIWMPLVRYDRYEKNDGSQDFDEMVFHVSYYPWQNVRAYLEYWNQIGVPSGVADDDRITLQVELAL
jgi:hypothetical protein